MNDTVTTVVSKTQLDWPVTCAVSCSTSRDRELIELERETCCNENCHGNIKCAVLTHRIHGDTNKVTKVLNRYFITILHVEVFREMFHI